VAITSEHDELDPMAVRHGRRSELTLELYLQDGLSHYMLPPQDLSLSCHCSSDLERLENPNKLPNQCDKLCQHLETRWSSVQESIGIVNFVDRHNMNSTL